MGSTRQLLLMGLLLWGPAALAEKPNKKMGGLPGPTLKDSLTTPTIRREDDDALLTCVVQNQSNFTLMWKKAEKDKAGPRILTANTARVTSDERFSVLHEPGGQVYVLLVKNVTAKDQGMYVCEVNSDPPVRSFHKLLVMSGSLQPPGADLSAPGDEAELMAAAAGGATTAATTSGSDAMSVWGYSTERPVEHDYTACCKSGNVSLACHAFCNLRNILDGTTGVSPTDCESDFPVIAECMADGRDHLPCCVQVGVPPACTDLCRGQYNVQTDNIKTQFSCAAYTAPTLACISAGIDLLPGRPLDFSAAVLNESAVRLTWTAPRSDPRLTLEYKINVTYLQFLSPVYSVSVDTSLAHKYYPQHSTLYTAPATATAFTLTNLEKFSLYEISMWTEGRNQGHSLPTYATRVVTHVEGGVAEAAPTTVPDLPDIKSCCIAKNVSHAECVNKFCDPKNVAAASVSDLMICAPWDTEVFACLADGRDHSPCCAAKQIPPICQELCSGKVTDINFKYFRCLSYMPQLSSCMLEGYGVLPSAPLNFRFSNVDTTFGILHWDRPAKLSDSVIDYKVNYQIISPEFGQRKSYLHAHSPFIMENLTSATTYEVYVEAVNAHGAGEGSSRIVFRTASRKVEDLVTKEHPYNQTDCCIKSGLKPECMPLCSYDAKMSEVEALATVCANDLSKVMRCAVGGRDHLPCCTRRGVPKSCQPLCQSVHQAATGADFLQCIPYIGQVFTCLEEGTVQLPPPVRAVRAIEVGDGRVVLDWKTDDVNGTFGTSHFEVYYKKMEGNATGTTVFSSDNQINTTVPRAVLDNLETGKIYRIFVVSRNEKGTSLPSSLLRVNASARAWGGRELLATTSPPHFLQVEAHSATWLQFTWNPPAITHPENVLKYRLYYHQVSANTTGFTAIETDVTTVKVESLLPNTQYIVYATALTFMAGAATTANGTTTTTTAVAPLKKVESEPSETLVAWTDPAFPAFVEAPTIHPVDLVLEGSSMTVLCIAMGTPLPTVTLYLDGHPIRSEVTRHMVTNIHNVTRAMGLVSCYADNGYGTPMQASRKITISRTPTVTGPMETHIMAGHTLQLTCKVDAFPAPTLTILKGRDSVQTGDRVAISGEADPDDPTKFKLNLVINNVKEEDGGRYSCHANNTVGEDSAILGVNVTVGPRPGMDVSECCRQQNVSSDCLDVCTFTIDFDAMLRKPQCLPEFHKLMLCAADGSDHRHCCSKGSVPAECLDWCRGEAVAKTDVCALSHSKTIIGCFSEGRSNLPGPPRNIRVQPINKSSALVSWDAPEKNSKAVELYRVFWRPLGAKGANKTDTTDTKLMLDNLASGTTYELVVKAGNSNGTSVLTSPLKFITADEYIIATTAQKSSSSEAAGVVVAVIVVLLVIGVLALVLYVMKKKNIVLSVKKPDSPTVAFENPFYSSRDTSSSHPTQLTSEEPSLDISSSGSWQGEMSVRSSAPNLETGEPDTPTTSAASLFQGLKLGRPGQGFRRFN